MNEMFLLSRNAGMKEKCNNIDILLIALAYFGGLPHTQTTTKYFKADLVTFATKL